jgi:hypothetical protein
VKFIWESISFYITTYSGEIPETLPLRCAGPAFQSHLVRPLGIFNRRIKAEAGRASITGRPSISTSRTGLDELFTAYPEGNFLDGGYGVNCSDRAVAQRAGIGWSATKTPISSHRNSVRMFTSVK